MGEQRRGGLADDFDWEKFASDYIPRIASIGAAITVWYISIIFSSDGFGFIVGNKYYWVGTIIAVAAVTVPEMLFNNGHNKGNRTLTVACGFAYFYGIVSNWIGLWVACGQPNPTDNPLNFTLWAVLCLPMGFMIEVLPEPMLNNFLGVKGGNKDFISQMMEALNLGKPAKAIGNESFQRKPDFTQSPAGRPEGFRPQNGYNERREETSKAKCPKCGSHNTQNQNGTFHCNACGNHTKNGQPSRELAQV